MPSAQPISPTTGTGKRVRHLKREAGSAPRAFPVGSVSLKDRLSFVLNAVGAQKMRGLAVAYFLCQAIHQRTGWRLPKHIAIKIGLECLRVSQRVLQRRKLEFQIRIRDLRLRYLQSELAQGQFDLRISTRLRLLEKTLQRRDAFCDAAGGLPGVAGNRYRIVQGLEVEVHRLLRAEETIRAEAYRRGCGVATDGGGK